MRIAGLYEYPIKACGGVVQETISLDRYGPTYDRKFMIINAKTKAMATQLKHPKLALVNTEIRHGIIHVSAKAAFGGLLELELARPLGEPREVSIHGQPPCVGFHYGPHADDFFSMLLGGAYELIRYDTRAPRVRDSSVAANYRVDSFADAHPLLVLSQGALDRLGLGLTYKNFRPTILVDDCSPHAEDEKLTLTSGRVRIRWVKLCERCGVPEVDPATGTVDRSKRNAEGYLPVTAALRATRPLVNDMPVFGSNYMIEAGGTLSVGDKLKVVSV